jgi:hypothetical protein
MPTATYKPLATVTLTSSASSVTFSNIPATYRDLILIISGSNTSTSGEIRLRFNSDSGSNYPRVFFLADSSNATISGADTQTGIGVGTIRSSGTFISAQIMDYSATNKHKSTLSRIGHNDLNFVGGIAARWANTAAITSVACVLETGNFASGSTLNLYGIVS